MSINNRLAKFAQTELVLAHNEKEREGILKSLTNLERNLDLVFNSEIIEFIRFGSFTRNTILPRIYDPNSDIDLMVVFNNKDGMYKPSTYRNWISDFLIVNYPRSYSKKDFPVVKLELNHIKFDIVPAYKTSSFLFGDQYYIPGNNGGWQTTTPNGINNDLSDKNKSYGNNVIRNVIRLCKHWNAAFGYPNQSFLMEKEIINLIFWGNEDTYSRFLKTINIIGSDFTSVENTIKWIKEYERRGDEGKQIQWLQKLLPGFS